MPEKKKKKNARNLEKEHTNRVRTTSLTYKWKHVFLMR